MVLITGVPPEGGSVAVVHPGVQHSRELARALYEGGMLLRFVTSVGGALCRARWLPEHARTRLRARRTDGIPDGLVVAIPWIEALHWAARVVLPRGRDLRVEAFALDLFDRRAAARALSAATRIVVGAENSSRHLFRAAKAAGATCVLDAASVHHSAQADADARDEATLARINARKDEEVTLADHIVVLSSYARDTYVAAGVPAEKISIVPPGVWRPARVAERGRSGGDDRFRYLFVGNIKRAKGIDLLLEAFARLDVPGKKLVIAGGAPDAGALPRPLPAQVEYVGRLDRQAVFAAYAQADVLVAPSRADGFCFVVAEAMFSGLPCLVSSAVGARDIVVHGMNGWIFRSGSAAELQSTMAEAFRRRADLAAMGARAREAAGKLDWDLYGERIRRLYAALLGRQDAGRGTRSMQICAGTPNR